MTTDKKYTLLNIEHINLIKPNYIYLQHNNIYMKRISPLILSVVMLAISCNTPNKQDQNTKMENKEVTAVNPGFIHAVYFWLKKDNSALLKEFKSEGLPKLATIQSIKNVYWGPPAGTPREVVDNSYDISWIVTFDNAAEQDKYQVDPIHLAFVEKYESLFEEVKVYDSIIENSK